MIAQVTQVQLDQVSLRKLMTSKKIFTWNYSNGDSFFNIIMMLCLEIVKCDPETKVGVQVLRGKTTNAKGVIFKNYISKLLEQISNTMFLMTDQGETHNNLISNSFNYLLTVPST